MSSNTNIIILTGAGYGLEVSSEAQAQKAEILKSSTAITVVNDPASNEAARSSLKPLAAMRILAEKSRKSVKDPVIKIGKDIDAKAAEFMAEIDAEEKRLSNLMGEYAELVERERQRVLREIEAKRQEEARIAREAEAARLKAEQEAEAVRLKAEREAEAARLAAEKAFFNSTTPEEEAAAKAREEEARAAEARTAELSRLAATEAARIAAEEAARREAESKIVHIMPEKAAGVKFEPDFEITDIDALYRHNAGLVTLTPKRAEILDTIKRQMIGETVPVIPGMRTFLKAKVSTR